MDQFLNEKRISLGAFVQEVEAIGARVLLAVAQANELPLAWERPSAISIESRGGWIGGVPLPRVRGEELTLVLQGSPRAPQGWQAAVWRVWRLCVAS